MNKHIKGILTWEVLRERVHNVPSRTALHGGTFKSADVLAQFSGTFGGTFRRKQRHLRGTKGRRLLHVPTKYIGAEGATVGPSTSGAV